MLNPIPFQIQGIPTLTLYEHKGYFEFLREEFPNSEPVLIALVIDQPASRSIADGPVISGTAMAGMIVIVPFDESVMEGTPGADRITDIGDTRVTDTGDTRVTDAEGALLVAPALSSLLFILPVAETATENELDSAPALASMAVKTPVSRGVSEPDSINSGPVLAAMTKT